jgi:hypothetical protein
MTLRPLLLCFGLSLLGAALPVFGAGPGEKGPKQSFEITSTQRVPFRPGGAIRLENSYGYLSVEGWDEPDVEITVIKSTDRFYEPDEREKAEQLLNQIRVVAELRSGNELVISTALPPRHNLFASKLPPGALLPRNRHRVTLDYTIRVPRDSRLVVHHKDGYVSVSDVAGDIEVNSHSGDMIVALSDTTPGSIDATTRLGSILSDLGGNGHHPFLIGTRFAYTSEAASRSIHLRMGRGSITIKKGPPAGPFLIGAP